MQVLFFCTKDLCTLSYSNIPLAPPPYPTPLPHPHQAVRRDSDASVFSEDDEYLLDQVYTDANSPGIRDEGEEVAKNEREKTVKSVECSLIMLMDRLPGLLEISNKHIYFSCDQQEKKEFQSC